MTGRLAVVVPKPAAERAMSMLRQEGVYDERRGARAYAEGVALPVTREPEETDVLRVVETDLPSRNTNLEDYLRERGWVEEDLDRAPASWDVVGSVILVDAGDYPRPEEVGEALLDLHGEADTVLALSGISGERREPDVHVIAGEGDTETVHTEHGTRYALDLAEVMFSPGNKRERTRMGDIVAEGECVFDMFAGIGYFTLPMARSGARVTAAEINPVAYRYLIENAVLNDVQSRVSAFRANCRDINTSAERVVMGYYDAHEYLDAALDALEPGGVVHLHEATPDAETFDRPIERVEAAAARRDRTAEVLDTRIIKTHAPGVNHVVVDTRVE